MEVVVCSTHLYTKHFLKPDRKARKENGLEDCGTNVNTQKHAFQQQKRFYHTFYHFIQKNFFLLLLLMYVSHKKSKVIPM